jgi:uncharacterized protein YkwD
VCLDIERDTVEEHVHERVNAARKSHGLNALTNDPELVGIARGHSEDMAKRGFFAHATPEGETFEDRYATAGYDCRVPTGDARYLGGAENIAKTHAGIPLETGEHHESAWDIAKGVVGGWLDSPGHRENLLNDPWRREGIGIYLQEEGQSLEVYVTQNFC